MLQGVYAAKDVALVQGVIAEDEFQGEDAARARKAIEEKYTGRVFCDRIHPDPPERGTHGKATLHLKPGAVPVTSRTIHLAGERLQALREMEEEWKVDRKIEPGRGPWRAAAFPVKKKTGKWRGVCDFALTNKMIHQDSYPLPLTENMWRRWRLTSCSARWIYGMHSTKWRSRRRVARSRASSYREDSGNGESYHRGYTSARRCCKETSTRHADP